MSRRHLSAVFNILHACLNDQAIFTFCISVWIKHAQKMIGLLNSGCLLTYRSSVVGSILKKCIIPTVKAHMKWNSQLNTIRKKKCYNSKKAKWKIQKLLHALRLNAQLINNCGPYLWDVKSLIFNCFNFSRNLWDLDDGKLE